MDKMEAEPFTHTEYLQNATESLLNCPDAMTGIRALPKGVHLFGHNHLQFHAEIERRLFVNPGSCGFPNDYDTRAAYTLIKHENNHNWQVTERRVSYNINEVTEAMETAGFSQKFPEWTRIYTKQLHTAVCHIVLTVFHLETTALKLGIDSPFDDAVWNEYWSDKK